ncbi:MAG: Ig-like domain-containing protein [Lautropia sp.]
MVDSTSACRLRPTAPPTTRRSRRALASWRRCVFGAHVIAPGVALVLAACSDGGNSPAASPTPIASAPAPNTPASPATAPAPASSPSPSPSPAPSPSPSPAPTAQPVASNHCAAFPNGGAGAITGSLAPSVSNPSGGALSYSLVSQPARGTLSLDGATGAYSYTPNTNARGYADTFTYRVSGSSGAASQASAKIVYGTPRIMPLGDSITHGVVSYSDATGDLPADPFKIAYRKRLQELLANGGYAFDFVGSMSTGSSAGIADPDHEGHSGFSSTDIDGNIAGWIAGAAPDIVLLHIGTNDHSADVGGVDGILAKVGAWAANPANRPVGLVLAKIIDQRPDSPLFNAVQPFNTNLASLHASRWADGVSGNPRLRVRLADMFSAIDRNADMTPISIDVTGLHPTASGFDKMAQVWYDTLVGEGFVSRCP